MTKNLAIALNINNNFYISIKGITIAENIFAILLLLTHQLQATLKPTLLQTHTLRELLVMTTQIVLEDHNYNIVNAIGLMKIGCTVTHLGNGLAITAGHCFKNISKHIYKNIDCSLEDKYSVIWAYANSHNNLGQSAKELLC